MGSPVSGGLADGHGRAVGPDQLAAQTTRAELVAILEELHDVLVSIDNGAGDRRYVDFGAMAKRLQECIDKVEALPIAG